MSEQLALIPEMKTSAREKAARIDWRAQALAQGKRIADLEAHLERRLGLSWEPPTVGAYETDMATQALPLRLRLEPDLGLPSQNRGNLILEGDNLLALRLLHRTHRGKIDTIFIDPPYNTGTTSWVYNDKRVDRTHLFRHSLWLDFLAQRLSLARDLLSPTGILAVCIGDETRWLIEGLLETLMPGRRIGSMVWRTRASAADPGIGLAINHEHVLLYGNSEARFCSPTTKPKNNKLYKNPDEDPDGPWRWGPLVAPQSYDTSPKSYFPIQNPKTGFWYPCYPDKVWRARRRATRFRKNLEGDGYLRLQLSVYARPCNGPDDVCSHQNRLEQMLPENGNVRAISLSDLQFVRMKTLVGQPCAQENTGVSEWVVFGEEPKKPDIPSA